MSDPFVGEIRMFAGNFAPRGYAFCDGQLLAVSQNDALFSLFGTIYGGDGRTTFGLPDLRGRIPIHMGSGPGLTPRNLGSKTGTERETVTVNQLPPHTHPLQASQNSASERRPAGKVFAQSPGIEMYSHIVAPTPVGMSTSLVGNTGGSQSHTNVMPFQCINFITALVGVFPSRT
jgi:microcystin-dependent protein